MPSPEQVREAILVLLAARNGGLVDVLNPVELVQTAARYRLAPEELMDQVLHVGNSESALRELRKMW